MKQQLAVILHAHTDPAACVILCVFGKCLRRRRETEYVAFE
jgi:hypothetical protein